MVTPRPIRRRAQRSGPVPVPSDTAPSAPAAAAIRSQPALPPPASARHSYAQAASSLPPPISQDVRSNGEALVLLAKAYPSLPADKVLDLHWQATGSKPSPKRSKNTTGGPSHRSFITRVTGAEGFDLMSLGPVLSQHLSRQGARLCVESYRLAYGGLYFTTTAIPSSTDLQSFESLLHTRIPEGSQVECEVPSSRSFLRILAAPFLLSDGSALTPGRATRSLSSSAHSALIQLAAPPRVIRDS